MRSRDSDDEEWHISRALDSLGDSHLSQAWPNANIFKETARAERVEHTPNQCDDSMFFQARYDALYMRWLDAERSGRLRDGVASRPMQERRESGGEPEQLVMPARIYWGDSSQALFWLNLLSLREGGAKRRTRWGVCAIIVALQLCLIGGIIQ